MNKLLLSAFADEYSDSFEEKLIAIKSFSFDAIELRHADKKNVSVLTKNEVMEIKKKLEYHDVRVSAIGSSIGKINLGADITGHIEAAKRIFETANILGTSFVRIFSFYAPDGKIIAECKTQVFSALDRLVLCAREYGITLCHENEANIYGNIPSRCREIIDYFDGEIRCVFDMGNYVLEGVSPYPDAYELLKERIAYFHIKDALSAGAIVPPGKGEAHIKEILNAYKAYSDTDTYISLEPHLQTFSGINALVGRAYENPYKYENCKEAFTDAVMKLKELIS